MEHWMGIKRWALYAERFVLFIEFKLTYLLLSFMAQYF